jgi:hypothetical protein
MIRARVASIECRRVVCADAAPIEKLGFERDHVSSDDRGELVWLTRSLPSASDRA